MSDEIMTLETPSLLHRMRVVASFALLGAVLAGMTTVIPAAAAIAPIVDFHAAGAVLGAVAGIIHQALRR